MKLNLKKPLVVFDLETTGLDMVKDRIIQMSYIKVMPDGSESRKNLYVNPGMPIPEEVVALTGISDEDVKTHLHSSSWQPTCRRSLRDATLQATTPTVSTCLCSPRNFCVQALTSTSASAA